MLAVPSATPAGWNVFTRIDIVGALGFTIGSSGEKPTEHALHQGG